MNTRLQVEHTVTEMRYGIDLVKELKVGTLKLPPPIPIVAERNPMLLLIKKLINLLLGISLLKIIVFLWNNICKDTNNNKLTKITTKISPFILLVKKDPRIEPMIIPGIHNLITLKSTLLSFIWERIEEIDVKTITPSDVATETCITWELGYPKYNKIKYIVGTMIIPPPTPNRPAIKPEINPVIKKMKPKFNNSKSIIFFVINV